MRHASRLLQGLALATLAVSALAHEGDPKVLDRVPPYLGPGFRRAQLSAPGGQLAAGMAGFAANGVTLMAWLPLSEMGSPTSGNDCWGYVSPSGREYVLMGHYNGTTVVEVTTPSSAQVLTTLPGPPSLWRDIKTYGDRAYAVSEGGGGIQVFDLSQVDAGVVTLVGNVGSGATHNVAIDEVSGFLYRTGGGDNGLRIHDLNANPDAPPEVAAWTTRYVHDAQIVTYTSGPWAGKQVAFCCSGYNGGFTSTGLDIIDVTNKASLTVLAHLSYPNPAYSHQGWLSPDRQYFYLGDELDENGTLTTTTHVIDVSSLTSPQVVGSFTNGNLAVGHNLYTVGNLIYEANYRSGLRVFDATNPAAPVETAFFDTFPANDLDGFNGLWNVYPYFPSGTVVGSDLERGLFVWFVGTPPLAFDLPNGAPTVVQPTGEPLDVTLLENPAGSYQAGSASLHWRVQGGTWQSAPLADLGGGNLQGQLPALPCGTRLEYYVSAADTGGDVWTSPAGAPMVFHEAVAAFGQGVVVADDLEADSGWTVGALGDTASSGVWTRVDPLGTAAQPEDDHSPSGTRCFVTGQGTNPSSVGENDVDGGLTTLLSPVYDLSSVLEPSISYWRWYSNDQGSAPNADIFQVDVSNDGTHWQLVEIVGPSGPESAGGWYRHEFRVADIVAPSATVQLRFTASDLGSGSIVEAAVDDLEIVGLDCGACSVANYCSASPNSVGAGAVMGLAGSASLSGFDAQLTVDGAVPGQPGLFYYGPNAVATPFGDGVRCVGGQTFRLAPPVIADAAGHAARFLDYDLPPANSGPGGIDAGETWRFQFWYRDPAAGGAGFNLSDGLAVTFCP